MNWNNEDLVTTLCILILVLCFIGLFELWRYNEGRRRQRNRSGSGNTYPPQFYIKGLSPAPKEDLDQAEGRVILSRSSAYGDGVEGHANLGLMWTGLLQNHYGIRLDHPIPSHLVLLMMAQNKANRAALPTPERIDDYVDNRNYVRIAWKAAQKGQ